MSRRVLFLMLSYPNVEKGANLYTDIVGEFLKQGEIPYVVAPAQVGQETAIYMEGGVNVLRVKTLKTLNVGNIRKGIANLLLPLQYRKAIDCFLSNVPFDLVVMPTPPITLIDVATHVKRKYGIKLYLILRDIFPQNGVDLGFFKKGSLVYRYFRKLEEKLYRESDAIGCMSEGNINYVCEHNPTLDHEKLHLLPNVEYIRTIEQGDDNLKAKYGIEAKFVAVFGGNMGKPQQLENILCLAERCKKRYQDVCFLFIGEGTEYNRLVDLAQIKKLENTKFIPKVTREDYMRLVSSCDIGIISLHRNFTIPNIPSKSLSYWGIGIPILASIDQHTDYGEILKEAKGGLHSLAGDIDTLERNFDMLYQDEELRKSMGRSGYLFMQAHYTPSRAYNTIINEL